MRLAWLQFVAENLDTLGNIAGAFKWIPLRDFFWDAADKRWDKLELMIEYREV